MFAFEHFACRESEFLIIFWNIFMLKTRAASVMFLLINYEKSSHQLVTKINKVLVSKSVGSSAFAIFIMTL